MTTLHEHSCTLTVDDLPVYLPLNHPVPEGGYLLVQTGPEGGRLCVRKDEYMAKQVKIKKPKVKRPKPGYLWVNRIRARLRAESFHMPPVSE